MKTTEVASAVGPWLRVAIERVAPAGSRHVGVGRALDGSAAGGLVLLALPASGSPGEYLVSQEEAFALPEGLDPAVAVSAPPISRALWAWELLSLELGEAAVITGDGQWAPLVSLVATWFGALPVLVLSAGSSAAAGAAEVVPLTETTAAVAALRSRLGGQPGAVGVDLTGQARFIDTLLEALPMFSRLLMAGTARESLTIDFYNNVHRKGLVLESGVFDPGLELESSARERLRRACRLLLDPRRAADAAGALPRTASAQVLA